MSEENIEQQEEKIVMGSKAEEIVNCPRCGKEIKVKDGHSFETEDGQEVYVCNDCIEQINQAIENETKNPNMLGAFLLGLVAALIGGLAWYLIATYSDIRYGVMTILIGWLVGSAVYKGSGRKRGLKLQIIAAFLTAAALIFSELFAVMQYVASDPELNLSFSQLLINSLLSGNIFNLMWEIIKAAGPIGLLIWGLGVFWAYSIPRPTKI